MGERGPAPKPNAVRPSAGRAGRVGSSRTRMEAAPASVPNFPEGEWVPPTRAWWDAWIFSPQAANFAATDWQRLVMLVPLVDAYFRKPTPQGMAEIRQNESKLGATAADRAHLGWTIDAPAPEGDGGEKPKGSRSRPDPRKQ